MKITLTVQFRERSRAFENSALRELKRASCNGGNNSFTDVSIIRRSYCDVEKCSSFFNFVAEGYRQKLNHSESFPIYDITLISAQRIGNSTLYIYIII